MFFNLAIINPDVKLEDLKNAYQNFLEDDIKEKLYEYVYIKFNLEEFNA